MIGGAAPSVYLSKLENGNEDNPAISPSNLDAYLMSHAVDPQLLREDKFEDFMQDRQKRLLSLIEKATGKAASPEADEEVGEDVESDGDIDESRKTIR